VEEGWFLDMDMHRVASKLRYLGIRSVLLLPSPIRRIFSGYLAPVTDLVGYETLLDWIKENRLHTLQGDVVEIGCFLGGGTAKLAKFFREYNKKVYAIDIFDPCFDPTVNLDGTSMSSLYSAVLSGRRQEKVFREATEGLSNIVVMKEDSRKVELPCGRLCFSFIDGCHDPEYVRNDFHLVWDKTVSSGVVGFHDYRGNLPQTTEAIDELIESNSPSIRKVSIIAEKCVILLTKI
jgi:SAM-dependent methyltransferase